MCSAEHSGAQLGVRGGDQVVAWRIERQAVTGERRGRLTGESGSIGVGPRFPLRVRKRRRGVLDELGGVGDSQLIPPGLSPKPLVKGGGRIDRVEDLLAGAPSLTGALLEQSGSVPVTVGQVVQVGLLQGCRQRDGDGVVRHTHPDTHRRDGRCVVGLLSRQSEDHRASGSASRLAVRVQSGLWPRLRRKGHAVTDRSD